MTFSPILIICLVILYYYTRLIITKPFQSRWYHSDTHTKKKKFKVRSIVYVILHSANAFFIFPRARTLNVDVRFLGFNYTSLSINRAILPFPATAFLPAALHVLYYDFHNPIHVVFLTVNVIQDLKRTHHHYFIGNFWRNVRIGYYTITMHDYNTNRLMSKPFQYKSRR